MRKRILVLALVMVFGLFLASCGETTPEVPALTSIVFSGTDNVAVDFESTFNILTDVAATGNDTVDYTADITWTSLGTISTTGVVDTTVSETFVVKYSVTVGELTADAYRNITVNAPQAVEGEMVVNPEFTDGIAGWDTWNSSGTITLSADAGALKAIVTSSGDAHDPRISQMNVPFELDTVYEVSFKAKASAVKSINLQVGELLAAAPYFIDFRDDFVKAGALVHKEIGLDWATYTYTFKMPIDNQNGGVIFALGKVDGEQIDATVWLDDISIEEITLDTEVPYLLGVKESASIALDDAYLPTTGVKALDTFDGDITSDIVVSIVDSLDAVVTTIDTSIPGEYVVTYTVEDDAENEIVKTTNLSVVGFVFSDTNLVANPTFDAALDTTTPEWTTWAQDWPTAPVVVTTLDNTAGTFALDITNGGDAGWAVQFNQAGIALEQGKTYQLSFDAMASVDRTINTALFIPEAATYFRQDAIALTTTQASYEYMFTVTEASADVLLSFELGSTSVFADGVVTFYNVAINELEASPILMNGGFDQVAPWVLWAQDWGDVPTVTAEYVAGEFVITTDKAGEAFWAVQFNQLVDLEAAKTYTLSFDARATVARDINVELVGSPLAKQVFVLTTSMQSFTVDVTTTDAVAAAKLSFEMGATDAFAAGSVILDNISLVEKDVVDAPELIVNGVGLVYGGHVYDNAGEGVGTFDYSDTGLEFVVTTLGSQAYTPHYYYLIDELAAGNYTVTFQLTSSVARDFRFNMVLPDAGYSSILTNSFEDFSILADETTTVTLNFTVASALTNVKIELDFGTLGGELVSLPGTFTLNTIMIFPNYN